MENEPIMSEDTAMIHFLISWYFRLVGRYNESEVNANISTNMLKYILGAEHRGTLTSMGNLATTYMNQGRWTEAEGLQVTVLETRKRVLGLEHPNTLASMGNLAHTLYSLGRSQDAITVMTDAMVHRMAKLGLDHPDTIQSQYTLRGWNQVVCPLSSFSVVAVDPVQLGR
jgi:hypothetical protein